MESLNFKRDMAKYITSIMKLENADKIINQYERGLITLNETVTCLKDNATEIKVREISQATKDSEKGNVYVYGMRLRPCGIGCQPKEGFNFRLDTDEITFLTKDEIHRYWDVITYTRKLTLEETDHFSLDFLGTMIA